ncbi:MAG: hypothetical protein KIS96_10880 [Bauldia sp.]|nr:hypothetical protein [Bauldia sp.]
MTIPTTYATLIAAVGEMRERSDAAFVAQVPTFVALAEAKLNRLLRLRVNEVEAPLAATPGSRALALPADFLDPVALFLTTGGQHVPLRPYAAGTLALETAGGVPSAFAVDGDTLQLDRPADAAHSFVLRYRKRLFALAASDPNWLLVNHPDVYLFAALIEAADWENDDNSVLKYDARLKAALAELHGVEGRHKAKAPLTADPGLNST